MASFVSLELDEMKFKHNPPRLCPRNPPKLTELWIFDHIWPTLTRFHASGALHSIENEILGMYSLLEMVYATFFDISDIKHSEMGQKLWDIGQI